MKGNYMEFWRDLLAIELENLWYYFWHLPYNLVKSDFILVWHVASRIFLIIWSQLYENIYTDLKKNTKMLTKCDIWLSMTYVTFLFPVLIEKNFQNFKNLCKLLYIRLINNKISLDSTGNYIKYLVINHNEKEYIYICITELVCCAAEINTTL